MIQGDGTRARFEFEAALGGGFSQGLGFPRHLSHEVAQVPHRLLALLP